MINKLRDNKSFIMDQETPLLYPTLVHKVGSPLYDAPASVQEIFEGLKINCEKIDLQLPFEHIEMAPQVCVAKILKG